MPSPAAAQTPAVPPAATVQTAYPNRHSTAVKSNAQRIAGNGRSSSPPTLSPEREATPLAAAQARQKIAMHAKQLPR